MVHFSRIARTAATLASACALLSGSAASASAAERPDRGEGEGAVFVQTNDPAGNQILAYRRDENGTLALQRRYATGGLGGAIEGAVADKLASQGALVYDAAHHLLVGVNAGSSSVYAFRVDDDWRLGRREVIGTEGTLPVSVTIHGDLLYVLDAGGEGAVQGYRIDEWRIEPIRGSTRTLNLKPMTGPTTFLNTPGQIGFTPDGSDLIVTTKANGNAIDVFDVRRDGRLSDSPVVTPSANPVPFAFVFDARGDLLVAEAGTSSVSTYRLNANDTLTNVASLSDGQAALCWIARARDNSYYVANAGSGTLSGYRVDGAGQPALIGPTGVVASPGAGAIDLAASRDGRFLYAQLGANGTLAEFRVHEDGSLTAIGSVMVLSGMEGVVAL